MESHNIENKKIRNTDCSKINCPVSKQPVYDSCQGPLTWVPPSWLGTAKSPESRLECVYIFSGRKRCSFQILGRIPHLKRGKPRAGKGRKWSSSSWHSMSWATEPSPGMLQEMVRVGNLLGSHVDEIITPQWWQTAWRKWQTGERSDSSPRLTPPSPFPSANLHRNKWPHEHILDFLRTVLKPKGGVFLVSFRWRSLILKDKGGQGLE